MRTSSIPPVVRDEPSRGHGPDLSAIGTDLVICDGEVMTYEKYCREREAETERDERERKIRL